MDKLQSRKDRLLMEGNELPERDVAQRQRKHSEGYGKVGYSEKQQALEIQGEPQETTKAKGQPNPHLKDSKVLLPSHADMRPAVKPRASGGKMIVNSPFKEKVKGKGVVRHSQPGKIMRSPFACAFIILPLFALHFEMHVFFFAFLQLLRSQTNPLEATLWLIMQLIGARTRVRTCTRLHFLSPAAVAISTKVRPHQCRRPPGFGLCQPLIVG